MLNMPELPEVESLRRSLEPYVVGKRIDKVDVRLAKLVSGRGTKRVESQSAKQAFIDGISRRKVVSLTRRAKNIIFTFDDNSVIIVHLKMTGQLIFKAFKSSTTFLRASATVRP